MRFAALFTALLYGAAALSATPAMAGGGLADPTDDGRAELMEMRGGDMRKLVIHEFARDPVTANFTNASGNFHAFEDFAGKVVLVNFWATWCPPCRKEMPSIDRLQGAIGGDDIEVVAINVERTGRAKAGKFYKKLGIENLKVYVDERGDVTRAMGVLGLPVTMILDREGREVARLQGDAEWDGPEAQAILRRIAEMTASPSG